MKGDAMSKRNWTPDTAPPDYPLGVPTNRPERLSGDIAIVSRPGWFQRPDGSTYYHESEEAPIIVPPPPVKEQP
jgi:hypothetical protein